MDMTRRMSSRNWSDCLIWLRYTDCLSITVVKVSPDIWSPRMTATYSKRVDVRHCANDHQNKKQLHAAKKRKKSFQLSFLIILNWNWSSRRKFPNFHLWTQNKFLSNSEVAILVFYHFRTLNWQLNTNVMSSSPDDKKTLNKNWDLNWTSRISNHKWTHRLENHLKFWHGSYHPDEWIKEQKFSALLTKFSGRIPSITLRRMKFCKECEISTVPGALELSSTA